MPQAYPSSPSARDESSAQTMTVLRNGANPSIWNLQSTQSSQSRDAPARRPQGQSWPTPTEVFFRERALASDPATATSTPGFSRVTEERSWDQTTWTSGELGPSTLRTAGSSPPNRARDGYLGRQDRPYGHAPRNSISRLPSFVDSDQESRGFGLNGTLDIDSSRRQEPRAPGFRGFGDAPSRDASLPSSRGTNGSPSMQERLPFPGGHTPSNSIGVAHGALPKSSPYTASPTHAGPSSRSFDSTARWNQQLDPTDTLGLGSLSLNGGSASSANGVGSAVAPTVTNGGFQAQAWQNNRAPGFNPDFAPPNGVPASTQAVLPYSALNQGLNLGHSAPAYAQGTGQYTPPQDNRSQLSSAQDLSRLQANGRTLPVYANPAPGPMNGWYPNGYSPNDILTSLQTAYPMAANSYMQGHVHPHFGPGHGRDIGAEHRSRPLQDFRRLKAVSNNTNNALLQKWNLQTVAGCIAEFSGDAHGSRFIQDELEKASTAEKDQALHEIRFDAVTLMRDLYGNYVIQKFLEVGTQGQKKTLAVKMTPIAVELSKNIYGCRVVQKVLDVVRHDDKIGLIDVLKPHLKDLMCDPNGNHVVQKIIDIMPRDDLEFVMETMRGQIYELSIQRFACRVVQKMLDKGTDEDRKDIFDEFYPRAERLAANEYGNYVAQALLEKGAEQDRCKLISLLTPMAISLSKQQAASNVVEKCIMFGTPEQVRLLHEQFSSAGKDGRPVFVGMMLHQYGNYTIQRLFERYGGPDETTLTPEQGSFRAEVQMAIDRLSWDEKNTRGVQSVATSLRISIPGPPAAGVADQRSSPIR